ncbi:hypothetical protein SISNIDRAFT_446202 [Sistotremastrum niveocremeum HHB9708]|uniref:ATP phosphoribosyltransferase n=2 Tax=Sistotremastraceae TaxID=3402574 RepID=A0A164NZS2_9AGAM|nr:hypothetical protein SISNIDRAFT_446202 [Sistotremastrum niveocremeum HHB9708]KZT36535.1 hypothetical protein SISSUDRAFT_1024149 [Sistotremastrum suecicum HHB10207 ss-3]
MPPIKFKLIFFTPRANTKAILDHLFDTQPQSVGGYDKYSRCAFVSPGIGELKSLSISLGQFLPGPGSNPTIGEPGKMEYVEEDRVEVQVVDKGERIELKKAVEELKKVHPYEEVAYEVHRLEDI